MRILYMGTPEFAVRPLAALFESGRFEIAGAVTREDRPSGRGYRLTPPPVKVYAEEKGIPVYQPATLRGEEFAELLARIDPDMIMVAAYGKILPHNVIAYPKYGCVNLHGSILPEYRGAAPINRAIIDGREKTGITVMLMDDGLDTGDILMTEEVAIGPLDDCGTVCDRLSQTAAVLAVRAALAIPEGLLTPVSQESTGISPTYAAKIEKADCIIDFTCPSAGIHNRIRGLSPSPLAVTRTPRGRLLKIISSLPEADGEPATPGTVVSTAGGRVTVACGPDGSGRVSFLSLIPEGKGRMSAADFIRGRQLLPGELLGY